MTTLSRARIAYSVGSERNPGDPFGRSELAIEVDGHTVKSVPASEPAIVDAITRVP